MEWVLTRLIGPKRIVVTFPDTFSHAFRHQVFARILTWVDGGTRVLDLPPGVTFRVTRWTNGG